MTDAPAAPSAPERGPALFAQIGPEPLRAVIADFYDRIFADVMIGFMFAGKDRAHLVEREYELTAKLLGAPNITYRGMPMRTAHAKHTIFGGQFERRLQILKETLAAHSVPADVQRVWLEHTLALRPQVTHDRGSECTDPPPKLAIAQADPPLERPVRLGRKPRAP